jgi:hypothetical protein
MIALSATCWGSCVLKSGFCGDAKHAPFDDKRGAWTADEFALEVLRAEGMDPLMVEGIGTSQSDYFRMIRARFVSEFGATVSVRDFEAQA